MGRNTQPVYRLTTMMPKILKITCKNAQRLKCRKAIQALSNMWAPESWHWTKGGLVNARLHAIHCVHADQRGIARHSPGFPAPSPTALIRLIVLAACLQCFLVHCNPQVRSALNSLCSVPFLHYPAFVLGSEYIAPQPASQSAQPAIRACRTATSRDPQDRAEKFRNRLLFFFFSPLLSLILDLELPRLCLENDHGGVKSIMTSEELEKSHTSDGSDAIAGRLNSAQQQTSDEDSRPHESKTKRWWGIWKRWKEGEESDWWFASTGIP